jgi:ribosome-binding protein aMBF1 (putative translation factor)
MTKPTTKPVHAKRVLDRITGDDPKLRAAIADHRMNAVVAETILAARERAGISQLELAQLVGTTQSVISRLENADYRGRSLSMLQRIATALDHRVEVKLIPARSATKRARRLRA